MGDSEAITEPRKRPGNPGFGAFASKGGKAKKAASMSLENVKAELGDLETLEDAQRWLRLIPAWALAGKVPGNVAGPAVRSVEIWLKAHDARHYRDALRVAERQIKELEAEVKASRRGAIA